ncbi:MAG: gamma-glutamyl-gamma-aminobutyrate hydrolase [Bacteroidetes bacterium B1(2017)]|nr:MAG: gamma-glutamyl-gamma-aminobutyrate hydrolase [Bacteroidetes bacterium B1(2017)]
MFEPITKKVFFGSLLLALVFPNLLWAQKIVLISKDKNKNIAQWLLRNDSSLLVKEFYFLSADSQQYYITHADGIVIGGGEDIDPGLYNKPEDKNICGKIDPYRDSIELVLINYAIKNHLPLFGICRGLQIINVALGGTLISDIPSQLKTPINHSQPGKDSVHVIIPFVGNTLLSQEQLVVNSSHHQCINKLAESLRISANSEDGIIEAFETKTPTKSFIAAIQWHPERLQNYASNALCKKFLVQLK